MRRGQIKCGRFDFDYVAGQRALAHEAIDADARAVHQLNFDHAAAVCGRLGDERRWIVRIVVLKRSRRRQLTERLGTLGTADHADRDELHRPAPGTAATACGRRTDRQL